MPRGRGRGTGTGKGRGRNSRIASAPEVLPEQASTNQNERHDCGMCQKDVGDNCIGCDKCDDWLHATEMCSGLPANVLQTLIEYDGAGIEFICLNCRVSKVRGSPNTESHLDAQHSRELLNQMFRSVKGMCMAVTDLTARMDAVVNQLGTLTMKPRLSEQPASCPDPPVTLANASPSDSSRNVIREEIREIREREKRKHSIIIRGLGASSPRDAALKFAETAVSVFALVVELTDVVAIPGHPDLYRAKILDDSLRKKVLEKAKSLKDSQHRDVFIRRDLTYKQRLELRQRRAQTDQTGETHRPSAPDSADIAADNPRPSDRRTTAQAEGN